MHPGVSPASAAVLTGAPAAFGLVRGIAARALLGGRAAGGGCGFPRLFPLAVRSSAPAAGLEIEVKGIDAESFCHLDL
jgi:hypothetical protein